MRTIKTTFKTLALSIILTLSFSACMQEELMDEADLGENVADNSAYAYTTVPCDFDLSNLQPNANIVLKCVIDLAGATVTLPDNVTLDREDGDIRNGTLIFGANSTIDGGLLNRTLTIGGRPPKVKNPAFIFIPSRWGIVEGETTSDIAQNNNNILEKAMLKAVDLGITTFKINEMDAYFEISKVTSTTSNQNFYPSIEAINIPSNLSLEMTDNTHLRTYPNGEADGRLIAFRDVSNSSIKGGNLYGERESHDYSNHSAGEGGNHIMEVHGAHDITIDGVKMFNGSKGGLFINAINFAFQPNYTPSYNVVVKNCLFENMRRMSVALTDGHNILFENNQFVNTARTTPNSDGGVVGFAINIEPIRMRDPVTDELINYELVHDVIIRNNTETGSRVGAVNIYIGDNILIDNNDFESKVGWSYPSNSTVSNNTFNSSALSANTPAISTGGTGDTVFNNKIIGNTINNYGVGISVYHKDILIKNNTINNCTSGIQLKRAFDIIVEDNNIVSTISSSRGIFMHLTWLNNVDIIRNTISVTSDPIFANSLNQNTEEIDFNITVSENIFNTPQKVTFANVNGITFIENQLAGIQIGNSSNMVIQENIISPTNFDGIRLYNSHTNISLLNNTIYEPTGANIYECINNNSTNPNEIIITGNTCN